MSHAAKRRSEGWQSEWRGARHDGTVKSSRPEPDFGAPRDEMIRAEAKFPFVICDMLCLIS